MCGLSVGFTGCVVVDREGDAAENNITMATPGLLPLPLPSKEISEEEMWEHLRTIARSA
jgi:hypothetical protein